MKIFSKFQDYYDSALGSFLDSDVAVYRKTSTINVPYKEIPRLGNYDFSYEVVKDINGRKQYGKLPVHMIGFCGTWYFFVYAQDSNTMIKLMNINEIVIPSGVTKIGDNAFAYLFSLKASPLPRFFPSSVKSDLPAAVFYPDHLHRSAPGRWRIPHIIYSPRYLHYISAQRLLKMS